MTTFERIKFLAEKQKKSLNKVEEELGYGKNVLYRLKNTSPSAERLQELADYFSVSTDYLLGRTDDITVDNDNSEDEFATFFRINTEDMPQEDKEKLQEELKEYFEFMKNRLKNK